MKKQNFRILFEDIEKRGFIGWTVIEDCFDMDDALDYFKNNFITKEIIQIAEVFD
jgi:hypothetical protein